MTNTDRLAQALRELNSCCQEHLSSGMRTAAMEAAMEDATAALAERAASGVVAGIHPKTRDLVNRFSSALLDKLAAAEKKYGYSDDWASPGWIDECRTKLREHVAKGDPRDVAAYCAFLWHHNESTASSRHGQSDINRHYGRCTDEQVDAALDAWFGQNERFPGGWRTHPARMIKANRNDMCRALEAALASLAPAAVEGDLNEQVKLFSKLKHLREFREFHLYRVIKTGNPGPQYTSGGGPSCRVKCWVCEQWVGEHYSTSTANYCIPCMKQCGSEPPALRNGDFETAERCRIELLEKYRDKCAQVSAITAQCDGLRKDAERYRWLRGNTAMTQLFSQLEFISHGMAGGFWPDRRMKEELDAAIDAAIAAGNGEGV